MDPSNHRNFFFYDSQTLSRFKAVNSDTVEKLHGFRLLGPVAEVSVKLSSPADCKTPLLGR